MLFHALIGLTFLGFSSCSDSAEDSQCVSLLLKNITDEIQSSIVVTLLNNAKSLLEEAKKYAIIKSRCSVAETGNTVAKTGNTAAETGNTVIETLCTVAETGCVKPMDCAEVKEKNYLAQSGIYKIWPQHRKASRPVEVYCDMEDDGGAWTVLQRRGDFGSETDYFHKDWLSYKNGFGDLEKDFWIGNDNIFVLTNQRSNTLKFTLTDWEGKKAYATYGEFWIDDEFQNYTLHVSGYKGTAGDSFYLNDGCPFSTKDRHNYVSTVGCAIRNNGAWWYKGCGHVSLNGLYLKGADRLKKDGTGIVWYGFNGYTTLKDAVMKIRP